MAFEIKTSIIIQGSPDQVWDVLTDFQSYPKWNPFLTKIEGPEIKEGTKLKIEIGDMKFNPKVLIYNRSKQFQWIGRLLMPGIFDGKHNFELIDNENGTTTLIHSEVFKGVLVPLLRKKLEIETKAGFEKMNQALKVRVEAKLR